MLNPGLFTSERGDWRTPPAFYDELDREFHFDFDPCPAVNPDFEMRADGLSAAWAPRTVFCNPPYGPEIGHWVRKGYMEARLGATVVMLVPSRTDTRWWHEWCMKGEVRFVRGRLKFGGASNPAPFPSAVVIFRPYRTPYPAKEEGT